MVVFRLPYDRDALRRLSPSHTIAAIWVRRMFIRWHRDQVGDDRCWLDDWFIWRLLDDTLPMQYFNGHDGMSRCFDFFSHRNERDPDTIPDGAIIDPERWDQDLWARDFRSLEHELVRIQQAIRVHRDAEYTCGSPRTTDDDRELYRILPEKIPADFRLPPVGEFLGEKCAPRAGCPWFWRSHATCVPEDCNLHRWGPCPGS